MVGLKGKTAKTILDNLCDWHEILNYKDIA